MIRSARTQARLVVLGATVAIAVATSCDGPRPYTVDATFEPTSGAFRSVHTHAVGSKDPGVDIVEAAQVWVTFTTLRGDTAGFPVVTKESYPFLAADVGIPFLGPGEPVEPTLVRQYLSVIGVDVLQEGLDREIIELVEVITRTAQGPKSGLPGTIGLRLVRQDTRYR